MSPLRKTSLVAGVLYLLTFVSIPTLFLYVPVLGANYIIGAGPDTAAIIGGISEIIVALAGIAAAVVLFPVLKRQNEAAALGLVAARILKSSTIFLGVAFLMAIVTLRQDGPEQLRWSRHTLAVLYDRIFLRPKLHAGRIRPVPGTAVPVPPRSSRSIPDRFHRSAHVSRRLPRCVVRSSRPSCLSSALSALPVARFEFSLPVWLFVRRFNPPITADMAATSDVTLVAS